MKKLFSISCLALFILGCDSGKKEGMNKTTQPVLADTMSGLSQAERLRIIRAYEDSMAAHLNLDFRLGSEAVKAYLEYQQIYWKDTNCADMLFKAAEIADNLGNPQKAITYYQMCHDQYLAYQHRAACLFRIGNIYDFELRQFAEAKSYYLDVIHFFPDSPMAEQAQAAIKNMGKSDLDLIREFEKKNGIQKGNAGN